MQARILASRYQKGTPADRLCQLKILRRMMGMDISYINAFLRLVHYGEKEPGCLVENLRKCQHCPKLASVTEVFSLTGVLFTM